MNNVLVRNQNIEIAKNGSLFSAKYRPVGYNDGRPQIHLSLFGLQLFLSLPLFLRFGFSGAGSCDFDQPQYGAYTFMGELWLWWGRKSTTIQPPCHMVWQRRSDMNHDGTWATETKTSRWSWSEPEYTQRMANLWRGVYPYAHTQSSGEEIECTATVKVFEQEFRPKWFQWTRLFAEVRRAIDVSFSEEIGAGRGSYKGGVVGVCHDMKPGESAHDTLKRMAAERNFNK